MRYVILLRVSFIEMVTSWGSTGHKAVDYLLWRNRINYLERYFVG